MLPVDRLVGVGVKIQQECMPNSEHADLVQQVEYLFRTQENGVRVSESAFSARVPEWLKGLVL